MLVKFFISGEASAFNELVQIEAIHLVDSVLEESVSIISAQQVQQPSESEPIAITCDMIGVDLIKSPTIESMSGRSFDDSISVPDIDVAAPLDMINVVCSSNNINSKCLTEQSPNATTIATTTNNAQAPIDMRKYERIERKFERLSSQLDIDFERNTDQYDDDFENAISVLNSDEVNNLQSDFSKISWDESVSATTADLALSTPDNDIQELPKGD